MIRKQSLTSVGQPVPELLITDVERAQQHYRDAFGFEIGWLYQGEIGAVSRGNVAIFFRKTTPPFEAEVHWAFAEDIDATYNELKSLSANIVEPLEKKPWGLRQFSVEDIDRNWFYFSPRLTKAPHNNACRRCGKHAGLRRRFGDGRQRKWHPLTRSSTVSDVLLPALRKSESLAQSRQPSIAPGLFLIPSSGGLLQERAARALD